MGAKITKSNMTCLSFTSEDDVVTLGIQVRIYTEIEQKRLYPSYVERQRDAAEQKFMKQSKYKLTLLVCISLFPIQTVLMCQIVPFFIATLERRTV